MTATKVNLSVADAKILNTVFDPESAPEAAGIEIDPRLPPDTHIRSLSLLTALRAEEVSAIRRVEAYTSGSLAQKHTVYLNALHILSGLIADHPSYASAYNNRAQLHRWRFGDRGVLVRLPSAKTETMETQMAIEALEQAVLDLAMAAELAKPAPSAAAVSPAQGKVLAQAWTQRAAIFWGAAKDLEAGGVLVGATNEWSAWDQTRFEEEGSRCFFLAGLFGSRVGKGMAVVANPHARLCGSIVQEALRRERCGV